MTKRLRIFLSSPGDAREVAALTIERLAQDYSVPVMTITSSSGSSALANIGKVLAAESVKPPVAGSIAAVVATAP